MWLMEGIMFNWPTPTTPKLVDRRAAVESARMQAKKNDIERIRTHIRSALDKGDRFVDVRSGSFYREFVEAVYEVANSDPRIADFRFHSYARWIDAGFVDSAIVAEGQVQFVIKL